MVARPADDLHYRAVVITRDDVEAAGRRIATHVRCTPVTMLEVGDLLPDLEVALKLEQLQHTGSFKARGALNRVQAAAERGELGPAGVVAASGGNAGLAVAHAAAREGVPARVYVPTTAPAVKVARLRELGADVVQVGNRYALAHEAAVAHAEAAGALFCHAYDQPEICAGQGTLALELQEQLDGEVDTVLVAVGGGGLMAGVAAALEGRARVVGVEPSTVPTFAAGAIAHPDPEAAVRSCFGTVFATSVIRVAYGPRFATPSPVDNEAFVADLGETAARYLLAGTPG